MSSNEASELGAATRRMMRALVRRAESGDLDALVELRELERGAGNFLALAIRGAHRGPGAYSYARIGLELGLTRARIHQLSGSVQG